MFFCIMITILAYILTWQNVKSSGLQVISVPEFPSSVGGPMFLGSPIWGSASFFASFVKEVVKKDSFAGVLAAT